MIKYIQNSKERDIGLRSYDEIHAGRHRFCTCIYTLYTVTTIGSIIVDFCL